MGRFSDPEKDIGHVCVLLGSEDLKYIGDELRWKGGMGQRPVSSEYELCTPNVFGCFLGKKPRTHFGAWRVAFSRPLVIIIESLMQQVRKK